MIIIFLTEYTFYLLIPSRILDKKDRATVLCYCIEETWIWIRSYFDRVYIRGNKKRETLCSRKKERGKGRKRKINHGPLWQSTVVLYLLILI